MEKQYIEDQIFEKLHFQESGFEPAEYEGCTFNLCVTFQIPIYRVSPL